MRLTRICSSVGSGTTTGKLVKFVGMSKPSDGRERPTQHAP